MILKGATSAPFLYTLWGIILWQVPWRPLIRQRPCCRWCRLSPYPTASDPPCDPLTDQQCLWSNLLTLVPFAFILPSVHHTTPMNFRTIIRASVRATLIQNGPQTCSQIVKGMGLNPAKHKGTIHALMVEMEREGTLDAIRTSNGKRDLWFIYPKRIRKRDRLIAAMIG